VSSSHAAVHCFVDAWRRRGVVKKETPSSIEVTCKSSSNILGIFNRKSEGSGISNIGISIQSCDFTTIHNVFSVQTPRIRSGITVHNLSLCKVQENVTNSICHHLLLINAW